MALTTATLGTGDHRMYYRGDGPTLSQLSPAMLMTTLNYQLFRCTPPEKYATMFLGCYDATMRELTYCNAGHLPPIVLSWIGRVSASKSPVPLSVFSMLRPMTNPPSRCNLGISSLRSATASPNRRMTQANSARSLITLIQEHRDQPLPRIGDVITSAVADWIGDAEQPDDVTVVLARAR